METLGVRVLEGGGVAAPALQVSGSHRVTMTYTTCLYCHATATLSTLHFNPCSLDGTLPICKPATACAFMRISPSIPCVGLDDVETNPKYWIAQCFTVAGRIDEAHNNLNDGRSHAKPGLGA